MPRTLLVVDDNQSVRESLRFLLLRRGYTVLVAEGGAEALSLAEQTAVDGAIIDVNMPGMNGIEVCRALRTRAVDAGREIAVWMMTGARTPETVRLAREAGAIDLFGKPFDVPALYRRFEEHFGIRTYSNAPFSAGPPKP
ncbi:MAG TPA: response regulator [Opitutaceae bacterium]|nr:response regulator [Opitutaceae bacterium]